MRTGSGFYVRSLARDLGNALGTVGHLISLRRTENAGFVIRSALLFRELFSFTPIACLLDRFRIEDAIALDVLKVGFPSFSAIQYRTCPFFRAFK